jgi:hypothetical protein
MTTDPMPGRYGRTYVRFTNFSPRTGHGKSLGKLIKLRPLRPGPSPRSLLDGSHKQANASPYSLRATKPWQKLLLHTRCSVCSIPALMAD